MTKLEFYLISTSSEGDLINEETIQIELNLFVDFNVAIENQTLFENLYKFGNENEEIILSLLKEKFGAALNPEEFSSCFYLMGIDETKVDFSADFFSYGDNEMMYFTLN